MIVFTFYSNRLCDSFSDFGYATTSTKMNELFTIYSRFESLFNVSRFFKFLRSNGQFYGSRDDQLMLQDRFKIKSSYDSGSYDMFVPEPIMVL